MTALLTVLGVIATIVFIVCVIDIFDRIKLKKDVRKNWGKPARRTRKDGEKTLKEAWEKAKSYRKYDSEVDDLTWYDLDFFEFFQKINNTKSSIGSEALYQRLRNFNFSEREHKRQEKLIQFFAENSVAREAIQYQFARLGKKDHNFVESYLSETKSQKLPHLGLYIFCACLPFVAMLSRVVLPLEFAVLLILASLVFNICYYQFKKVALEVELNSMAYLVQTVSIARKISKIQTPFQTELQQNLTTIRSISKFGFSFRVKSESEMEILVDYLNAIIMLPFISYHLVLSKIIHHDKEAQAVWHLLGELEVALAVLNLRLSSNVAICQPTFTENFQVLAENVAHPLLTNPVANPVNWRKNTLITGSNASGKSTYVKAIAINCILANTINLAFASHISLPRATVLTSMAIEDDIFAGDSYFVAEIKSVKRVLDLVASAQPCLCFVDEILKGTNTIERISASSGIIEWLSKHKQTLAFVATHDIELTEILSENCENVHFEEQVTKENGVTFDYSLRQGPATTRNAIELLQVLQYPKEIVLEAKVMAKFFDENRKWQVLK
ncbi:DNA mismatch repair protein MutS [Lactococcus hodotermopsidis]|uniref:DNA mismatch repair protein MutS n=1 Tax=Pseudolactococcus hodotermopsidis TaxID=2709157 RepID=A0A6A0BCG2_9LACT|nr:DNA mismatch repair protein MutS [Lactococcus hodotermopsidis]GFH41507.1 DNA mismatch repair protein MutS [Lactococcus hodotermopsidis]